MDTIWDPRAETMSADERADLQASRLGDLLARLTERSPLYRDRLACAGAVPGTLVHNPYGYGLFTGGLGMHAGAELMGCTLVPMSGGQTQRQVTLLRDLRPESCAAPPRTPPGWGRRSARPAWPGTSWRCGPGSSGRSRGVRPCAPRSRACCR